MTDKKTKDNPENSDKKKLDKTEERQPYSGIVTDIRSQEEEVKQLEQEREETLHPEEKEKTPEQKLEEKTEDVLDAEELTWKGRYGEGRKYQQKLIDENRSLKEKHKEEIAELKENQPEPSLPATEEEMSEFMEKAPNAAKVMQSLIIKEARKLDKRVDKKLERLEDDRKELRQNQSKFQLERLHPDIEEVNMSPEFKEWIKKQPDTIQDALFKGLDSDLAASIIDWFKADSGWKTKKKAVRKKEDEKSAAESISTKGQPSPEVDKDEEIILASDVAKMSTEEFEKNMKKIDKARREGKFVQDI